MNGMTPGFYSKFYAVMLCIILCSAMLFSGCTVEPEEPEIDPAIQDEFLSWAVPLYRQVERSDRDWLHLSNALVFYVDDEEEFETLEGRVQASILLHRELLDEVNTSSAHADELLLNELSEVLFQTRLQAGQEIMAYLENDEKPDLQSIAFQDIRASTKELATSFESIMREYEVVWAHLKYHN